MHRNFESVNCAVDRWRLGEDTLHTCLQIQAFKNLVNLSLWRDRLFTPSERDDEWAGGA